MNLLVSKQDLLAFAKKLYAEGFGGYMDLCDGVCEKLVEEFAVDKKTESAHTPLTMPQTQVTVTVPNLNQTQELRPVVPSFWQTAGYDWRSLGPNVYMIGDGINPEILRIENTERQ